LETICFGCLKEIMEWLVKIRSVLFCNSGISRQSLIGVFLFPLKEVLEDLNPSKMRLIIQNEVSSYYIDAQVEFIRKLTRGFW